MTTTTDTLSVSARRRALCEIADLYAVEQKRGPDRPITALLPLVLPPLTAAAHLTSDAAIDLFDRFARAQAVSGHAHASYAEMNAAEVLAEQLLDQLVGEAMP